jgi:hypothetical protein
MTIKTAVRAIERLTRKDWNKSKPIPDALIADLCDALWAEGEYPQIKTIREYCPNLHDRAIRNGFHAWRLSKGFHRFYSRSANPKIGGPAALTKLVSPAIASAPLTFFDPENDGRWKPPLPEMVAYLAAIQNQSLRDVMTLYALIKADMGGQPLYCRLSGYAVHFGRHHRSRKQSKARLRNRKILGRPRCSRALRRNDRHWACTNGPTTASAQVS